MLDTDVVYVTERLMSGCRPLWGGL